MKKYTFLRASFFLMAAFSFVACQTKGRLAEIAEEVNKQCPISIGMAGNIVSVEFDGTDIVYNALVSDIIDIDDIERSKDIAKQGALQIFVNPDENVRAMVEELKSADAGMKIVYKDRAGKSVTIYLSIEEILSSMDNPDVKIDPETYLQQQIMITNQAYPQELGGGLTMISISMDENNVVYECSVDESVLDMDDFETGREAAMASLQEEIVNLSKDPAAKVFVDACRETGRSIVYRYVGATTGKVSEFSISL